MSVAVSMTKKGKYMLKTVRLTNKEATITLKDGTIYHGNIFHTEVVSEGEQLLGYISIEQLPNDYISTEQYGKTAFPCSMIKSLVLI